MAPLDAALLSPAWFLDGTLVSPTGKLRKHAFFQAVLEIHYSVGPKQEMQYGAKTENTSGARDESPHGGGQRPPHIMWPASMFSICLRLHFLLWPTLYFLFWPHIVFPAVFF